MKTMTALKAVVTSKTARQLLFVKYHSPKILFIAGTIGVVGTVVLACRATLKMDDVLEQSEKDQVDINHLALSDAIDEDDYRKQIMRVKLRTGFDIAKLYLPAVGLGAVSIAALTGSHVILTKRNGIAMAAYAALDRAYKEYRERVTNEYGEDVDRRFAIGAEAVEVEEKTSDGKTKMLAKDVLTGRYGRSPYAEVFDERSRFFSREPGLNASIVLMKQNYANDKLRAQGHLYLNEVLDLLGLPRSKAGTIVGWVYRHDNEKKTGDNYVDFGVFGGDPEWVEAFVDGDEKYVTLDFNVDGEITDILFARRERL